MTIEPFRIGIYGSSGTGKTTLARYLIRNIKRLIVFDPMEDYGGGKGWVTCHSIKGSKGIKAVIEKRITKGFKIAYIPVPNFEMEALHELSEYCLWLQSGYSKNKKIQNQLTLVVDELNLSYPARSHKEKYNGFPNICSRGRNSGINVYGLSQRVAEVNTRFRGNTSSMYILRQGDLHDIDTLSRMLFTVPKEDLITMKNFEVIYRNTDQVVRFMVPKP